MGTALDFKATPRLSLSRDDLCSWLISRRADSPWLQLCVLFSLFPLLLGVLLREFSLEIGWTSIGEEDRSWVAVSPWASLPRAGPRWARHQPVCPHVTPWGGLVEVRGPTCTFSRQWGQLGFLWSTAPHPLSWLIHLSSSSPLPPRWTTKDSSGYLR